MVRATTLPVPRRTDDLTAAWMSQALGADVTDVTITGVIGGTATKVLMKVVYGESVELPNTLCFKGGMGEHAPFMAQVGIYATEALFFRDERAHSKVRTPRVYWADVDEEAYGGVLMEDLSQPSVRFCSSLTPLAADEVAAVLENAALLHAGRWNDPWLQSAEWLECFAAPDSKGAAYFRMLGPDVVDDFIHKRRGVLPAELMDARRCLDIFWAYMGRSGEGPQTLVHGDLHVGNVYFDGGTAAICDWQVLGKGSPAYDVAYFIASAMSTVERRLSEKDLLRHYLGALAAAGVAEPPGLDEMWRLYRIHMAYGMFAWLTNPEAFQSEEIISQALARLATAVVDLDTATAVGLRG